MIVTIKKALRLLPAYVAALSLMLFSPWLSANHATSTGDTTLDETLLPETPNSLHLDTLTQQALQAMVSGDWYSATQFAEQLVDQFPDYALGQLLLAEAHSVSGMSTSLLQTDLNYSQELVELLQEARSRLLQTTLSTTPSSSKPKQLPAELIQVGKHIDHVVMVDLRASTLFLFDTKTSQPQLIKQHYISSGEGGYGKTAEGDLKSPLGVYRIHGFRSDESLPSLYGSGALMLNYPNALDRALGRTGSGIWLHGNPRNNRSRSPHSSEGCVTMANDYLEALHQKLDLNRTHVVLSQSIVWSDTADLLVQRERFQELFDQYKQAWLNSRASDLAAIYAPDALPAHVPLNNKVRFDNQALTEPLDSHALNSNTKLAPLGIDLHALAAMEAKDVSLVMNPDAGQASARRHMVMSFELPGAQSATVTLYWELGDEGYWQIKREAIESGKA